MHPKTPIQKLEYSVRNAEKRRALIDYVLKSATDEIKAISKMSENSVALNHLFTITVKPKERKLSIFYN